MKTIILTGVPGVGKSAVGKQCATDIDDLTYYGMGDFIRLAADGAGDVRSELYSTVTRRVIARAKLMFADEVRRQRGNADAVALLDSHTSTHGGVSVRFTPDSPELLREFGVAGLIQLVATPDVILTRRQDDSAAARHGATAFDIELAQNVMIASTVAAAQHLTVPCQFVDAAGSVEEVADRVKYVLRQLIEW